MRNRDTIVRQLELLEGRLNTLKHIVNTQSPISEYYLILDSANEILEEVKSYVEAEDLSSNEVNRLR